ncbi:hypothetical protein E2C01_044222 [Portunus trituberculatus]|uniref:Uncharacterized protein n=1 Tax=Portunus trituberculatus TaxID=210409 RepID=A0A5B7FZD5_PORTR|nr:hypothetical protein [Portunus trituberculatus]
MTLAVPCLGRRLVCVIKGLTCPGTGRIQSTSLCSRDARKEAFLNRVLEVPRRALVRTPPPRTICRGINQTRDFPSHPPPARHRAARRGAALIGAFIDGWQCALTFSRHLFK